MDTTNSIQFLYSVSGFFVGLLVGMTGVGGGSLMTPVLILLFGIHPAAAVGTDLLACGGDQDRRQHRSRLQPHHRLARGAAAGRRQRSHDRRHAFG